MIPVNRPLIPKNARKYLNKCLTSGWLSSEGPFVERFEKKFAEYLGVKYATSTNSGTTALHLAILALGIGKGDEVILPASTIASCYFAIWYTGAKAVPIDVDPVTYTINPSLIEAGITNKTKAIMAVHLFGHPCDMDPIRKIAGKYHLSIIEDAAEAHGAEYKGQKVGNISDVACFSFYANKIVTCGEGGMITANNKQVFDYVKRVKTLNHVKNRRFTHEGVGYNYLMSNMQAAVGLASLEEIDKSLARKLKIAGIYNSELSPIHSLILPSEKTWAKNVYWMYAVRINPKISHLTRSTVMKRLATAGIQTRTFFYSPKSAFAKMGLFQNSSFPVSEELETTGFYLPSGLGNTVSELKKTVQTMKKIFS